MTLDNVANAVAQIVERCDPVFAAAAVSFARNILNGTAVVYQADPLEFLRAYPDSEIDETYSIGWPPYDINFWIEVRQAEQRLRVVAEGWQQPELFFPATDESIPAARVAEYFASLLTPQRHGP